MKMASKLQLHLIFANRSILVTIAFLFFVQSCSDKTGGSSCGCKGNVIHIDSLGGVVALTHSGDYVIITDKLGIISPCSGFTDNWKVDGTLIFLSGSYIASCSKIQSGFGVRLASFDVTSISKVDTLFTSPPVTINIIQSVGYGYASGFGYKIQDAKKPDFIIEQPNIPGLGHNITFKTPKDAFKIAVLVCSKLENANDFPTVNLGELFYLNIVDQQN